MSELTKLIIANHNQALGKFQGLDELITYNFAVNAEWQANNGAEPTSTLTRATIERPNGKLDKLQKQVTLATEGSPAESANDADYNAAIAAGTAVAAGTLGYAGFKNRNFLGGKLRLAMNSIDFNLILNALNLVFSMQSAMMLSRDIVETSIQLIDTTISVFMNAAGLKNFDEDTVDFGKMVKTVYVIIRGIKYGWNIPKVTESNAGALSGLGISNGAAGDRDDLCFGANFPKPPRAQKVVGTEADAQDIKTITTFYDPTKTAVTGWELLGGGKLNLL